MNPALIAPRDGERDWLLEVLTRRIPLGGAMELSIERLDDHGIELAAPLAPNVNDKGTAFGGALASLMILAGWALPRLLLRRAELTADLVIGRCEVDFIRPVAGGFGVRCDWPGPGVPERFVDSVSTRGRGRLELVPSVIAGAEVAAGLRARYAAIPNVEPTE